MKKIDINQTVQIIANLGVIGGLIQYRMGLFDEGEYLAERLAWERAVIPDPIAEQVWCLGREMYSPEFRREIDSLLPAPGCSGVRPVQ